MEKVYSITVRGKEKTWSFNFTGHPEDVETWREDGLEIDEIVNTIPEFVHWLGATKLWCWLQDIGLIKL